MFCKNCGSEVENANKFCQNCGTGIDKPKLDKKRLFKNKNALVLILIASLIIILSISTKISNKVNEDEFVYRNMKWGMSKEEVKEKEFLTLEGEKIDSLYYYLEPDVHIMYSFNDEGLFGAAYIPTQKTIKVDMMLTESIEMFGDDYTISNHNYEWYTRNSRIELVYLDGYVVALVRFRRY